MTESAPLAHWRQDVVLALGGQCDTGAVRRRPDLPPPPGFERLVRTAPGRHITYESLRHIQTYRTDLSSVEEEVQSEEESPSTSANEDEKKREAIKLGLAKEAADRRVPLSERDAWVEDRFDLWLDGERMFSEIEAERTLWQGGYALRHDAQERKKWVEVVSRRREVRCFAATQRANAITTAA